MSPSITLSPQAREHLGDDLHNQVLRISFTTGCGGSGYRLSSASDPQDDDIVLEIEGVRIALDDMSASRLDGAVIEYDVEEDGYTINHPDAVAAVWCG